MLSGKLISAIESALTEKYVSKVLIKKCLPIGGGCINNTMKIETSEGNFFLKHNEAKRYPKMFEAEAKGLQILKSANEIFIPEVICYGEYGEESILVLEFLEPGKKQKNFFEDFGIRLAKLHKHSSEKFGLDHNNYIGSLPQSNKLHKSWIEFFIEERLEKQVKLARDSGAIGNLTIKQFNNLYNHFAEIFPNEKPSLLHGDLWNGNYMAASDGYACIIDPAVYYGFREMDIAMSKLFGGFSPEFYSSYNNEFPMEKGWQSRIDICNLYPLMVHVNLFGGGYLQEVKSILRRYE